MDELIKAAMTALLNDAEAKPKVLAYIQALVDEKQPKEEWRQVWWQLSDDVRRYDGTDIYTTQDKPPVRLYMEIKHSYRGVGILMAYYVSESFDPNNKWNGYGEVRLEMHFHKEAFDAKNYVDAIVEGQIAWKNLHAKWEAATLPLADNDAR